MQKLKLSQRTIQIFKNFSSINPSVHIKPGKTIATISSSKSIMAKAVIEEEFETEIPDERAEKIRNVTEAVQYIEENLEKE